MHLKSLEMTGFKSFAETKIEFPRGITAVVGPNGTGKSNVVDAILWVLGEQSAKTLRSERMDDVIFNGTQARKPLGMAEVSLILGGIHPENLDAVSGLPEEFRDYHEVMVTRRLYRSGESEYLINKTLCRLKDLRSLFLETRAGSKGHTIIEQGRIEQILNASPQERRELIEETAGIVRYKKQKAEALRKLDATQQNLLRVRDIVSEVHRQLKSLERQARQARSYKELQQEARTLEVRLVVRDYRGLSETRGQVETELSTLETREAEQLAEQGSLDSRLGEARLAVAGADEVIARLRQQLAAVEYQQAHALTAVEVERGRVELFEQQRVQALAERDRLEREQEQSLGQIEALRVQLAESDGQIAQSEQILGELEEAGRTLTTKRTDVAEQEAASRLAVMDLMLQATNEQNNLANLEVRREELARRAERLESERRQIEIEHDTLRTQLQGVVQERQNLEQRLARQQAIREARLQQLQSLEDRIREMDLQLSHQQETLAAVESRLEALQSVLREEMGYGRKGEEDTTSLRAACNGILGAVAEWLMVPAGYERAFEAVLGERMRAWLVERPSQVHQAVQFLKEKKLGRGTFVPMRPRWSRLVGDEPAALWWTPLKDQPGVLGRALDLVQVTGPEDSKGSGESAASVNSEHTRDILRALFGRVVIIDNLKTAIRLWEQGEWSAPTGPILVTLEGEFIDAAGLVTAGSMEGSQGLLQRKREIQQLNRQRAELSDSIRQERTERDRRMSEQEAARATLVQCEHEIREAEARLLILAKEEARLGPTLEGLQRRLDIIVAERRNGEEERAQIEHDLRDRQECLERLLGEKARREARLTELQQAVRRLDDETLQLQDRIFGARLSLAEARSQREHGEAEMSRLMEERAERTMRSAGFEQEVTGLGAAIQRSEEERERNQRLFQEMDGRATQFKTELTSSQEAQAQDMAIARRLEDDLSLIRAALQTTREARMDVQVRRAEVKTQLAALESTLTGTYQLTVDQALADNPPAAQPLDVPSAGPTAAAEDASEQVLDEGATLKQQLQRIRERLDRMGPINLAAIEEHRELDERYRFLTSQEVDLTNSIASLREIINRINRTSRQMFMDTFNELQLKFGEMFGRFFAGGRAELVLVDPQQTTNDMTGEASNGDATSPGDAVAGPNGHSHAESQASDASALEPGVDIVAQPPGKRLKNISMLSGGEKTLTAMALIFASFMIRPTPFCILDEIDAPLDEENIGRFSAVLRDLSEAAQFVVITHSRHTMAVADSLFGVTMEEPGVSKIVSVRLNDLQPA
jgi:chromosome segregation protein